MIKITMKTSIIGFMLLTGLPLFAQSADELGKESRRYLEHSVALTKIIINSKTKADPDALDLQKLTAAESDLLRSLANHRKDIPDKYSVALLDTFASIHKSLLASIKMLDLRIKHSSSAPEIIREMHAILASYRRTQLLIKPAIDEAERHGIYKSK